MPEAERVVVMARLVLDLGTKRVKEPLIIREWEYMYVGDCTGNVLLQFDNTGWVDPSEFDKITDCSDYYYLYFENEAQEDERLALYYEEKKRWWQW